MVLVWMIIYRVLLLIRRTGTVQMLSGLGVLGIAYLASIWLEFHTFNWLLEKFFNNLFVIMVIIFQGEIRHALAHIGSNPLLMDIDADEETHVIEEICRGVMLLAQRGFGALLVLERDINVDYHIEGGSELDSQVSSEILLSIFHPSSPLHDGAVLIRHARIDLAGCFLPLSQNPTLNKNWGTRHRAAMGLTDETDAVVLVVSEESKMVSVVQGGEVISNLAVSELRGKLYEFFGLKPSENRGAK